MLGVVTVVVADNEGIQAFEPMHQPEVDQFFQRPVDLQRGLDALSLQSLKDRIGAERRFSVSEGLEDQLLVCGKHRLDMHLKNRLAG